MKQSWQRDDSAVQRRVADLKAAGLNPVLAASGAGSPNSGPIRVNAETLSPVDLSRGYAAAMGSRQYARTSAEAQTAGAIASAAGSVNRASAQAAENQYDFQRYLAPFQEGLAKSAVAAQGYQYDKAEYDLNQAMWEAEAAKARAKIQAHDASVLEKFPDILSTSSGNLKDVMGGIGMLGSFMDKVSKWQFQPKGSN